MKKRLFTPAHRPLARPADGQRLLRRPDLRHAIDPRLSGMPLGDEVDHDELIIHRSYRTFDSGSGPDGATVRYFVFEFSQKNPGEHEWFSGVKVVRLLRLTRVPRYLRAGSSSGLNLVFTQQRDVLAALREQQVLFLNLIAKADDLPMAFCYGTQAVGATFEEAAARCDESFGVLEHSLHGTYQQLQVKPLSVDEGERLSQYQAEWRHVAMARGRPKPAGGSLGASALLDGNRTDIESANNQLEVLLRGMANSQFMMTLVTVPLNPAEMSLAWRNLAQKLSEVRSDQQGARAVSAGVALPLTLGTSFGAAHGDTHGVTTSQGIGDSHGISQSISDSHAISASEGVSASVTDGASHSTSVGMTDTLGQSVAESVGMTDSVSQSAGQSVSLGESISQAQTLGQSMSESQSFTESASMSQGVTESVAASQGMSQGITQGVSESAGVSESVSQGQSITAGQSLAQGSSLQQSWSNAVSEQFSANLSNAQGWSQTLTEQLSQSFNLGSTQGDSTSGSQTHTAGSNASGGLLGFSGGGSVSDAFGLTEGRTISDALGMGLTAGGSNAAGVSGTQTVGMGQGIGMTETAGGSVGQTSTATNSIGQSQSVSQSQAASQTFGRSVSESLAASQTLSHGMSNSQAVSQGISQGVGLARGVSLADTVGHGTSLTHGQNHGVAQGSSLSQTGSVGASQSTSLSAAESSGVSRAVTEGQSRSAAESVGQTITQGESAGVASNQALSDAYMVAMSRTAATTGSLGAVPSVGVSITRQTFDESKRMLGDVLQSQMRRFVEGIESGAFLYQLFVTAPDRTTLLGAAGLMKSAFWGAGDNDSRIAQPFHTIVDFEDEERGRLLEHARCFTSYRRREPVTEEISPFLYSSYITPSELSAFSHPPTANALGLEAQFDSSPVLAMPADRGRKELYLGQLFNGERAEVSKVRIGLDVEELTHTLIAGVTGSGKALALDTPIPTPSGWATMGELEVGDKIFGADGKVRRVTFRTDTMEQHDCFEVRFSDGSSIVADADHLWDVSTFHSRANARRAAKRGPGMASKDRAASRRVRLAGQTHGSDERSLDEAAAFLEVAPAVVRRAVKAAGVAPSRTETRTMSQRYDNGVVEKCHHLDVYRIADVAAAVAELLETRAVSHDRMPLETLLTTREMSDRLARRDGGRNLAVKVAGALELPDAGLPVDPYLLGVWLGDGSSGGARLYIDPADVETIERVRACGYEVRHDHDLTWTVIDPEWQDALDAALAMVRDGYSASSAARACGTDKGTVAQHAAAAGIPLGKRRYTGPAAPTARKLHTKLRELGVLGNKHIPAEYLRGSYEQRLALLQGLMDTDGTVNATGHCVIELTNETIVRGAEELVRSLGIAPSFREGRASLGGADAGPTWAVAFTTTLPVALLARKAARLPQEVRSTQDWRYITDIVPVASVPVRCIEVDAPDHLFLAGEAMVPTHNTTTLMRMLTELTQVERAITDVADDGRVVEKPVRAGVLGLDWMRNMRNLASIVDPERFRFFSIARPELGEFRWNLLAIPHADIAPTEWLNQMADNMVASWSLGEFGRSLVAEYLTDLYSANRLEDTLLYGEDVNEPGAIVLPAIDRSELPQGAVQRRANGEEYANVFTCPELSRLVSVEHLAVKVMSAVEVAATPEGGRTFGTSMRDRLQSLWRRVSYFAPNGSLNDLFGCDSSLADRETLGVRDLVDPELGLVTIVETDGLDMANRRLVLGSVLLAVYRYGLATGEGCFDHDGQGPGTYIVLEESHELFGESAAHADDRFSSETRTALYESLFRRARALGVRLVAVAQNPGSLPVAITSNTSTVMIHKVYDSEDRQRCFDLLNWSNQVAQQQREWRWLGEMPQGYCIVRLHAKAGASYLASAPFQMVSEPAPLELLSDADMARMAAERDSTH